jgi:GrpB-like predicted nucleotidyltransferase (UPF0157 family)
MPVVVVPYDPQWPLIFEELRDHLLPVVGNHALAIEHVGSTSVSGLAAKPIINVDVVVESPEASERVIAALVAIGYTHLGPLGLEGREAMRPPQGTPRHNLYVCLESSEPYRNHILVRNHLRSNPSVAKAYGELKLALAARYPEDIESYIDGKTDFLIGILRETGFPQDALDRAEAVNRKK